MQIKGAIKGAIKKPLFRSYIRIFYTKLHVVFIIHIYCFFYLLATSLASVVQKQASSKNFYDLKCTRWPHFPLNPIFKQTKSCVTLSNSRTLYIYTSEWKVISHQPEYLLNTTCSRFISELVLNSFNDWKT